MTPIINDASRLLTPNQVAEILGVDVDTLNVWRCTRRYKLPYVKTGRLVRYRLSDLNQFIESRTIQSG
jgi:excisionase family DNA binding protein